MIIELMGCTSSGKSTLLQHIIARHRGQSPEVISAKALILRKMGVSWLKNDSGQRILINVVGLAWSLAFAIQYKTLFGFLLRVLRQIPAEISVSERIKIARIAVRNLGIYHCVKHFDNPECIVILDEGTLHIAHYLFVYENVVPDIAQTKQFISQAPLPDGVVFLRVPRICLVERTLARGHARVNSGSEQAAQNFVDHALAVFDCVNQCVELNGKLVTINRVDSRINTHWCVSQQVPGSGDMTSVIDHLVNG